MQIKYPFSVSRFGQVAEADEAAHLEQMIEQVLFTSPGERVNRPDFGCGLSNFLFEPANSELVAVTEALVRGSLIKWLGSLIHIDALTIDAEDNAVIVRLSYAVLRTQTRRTVTFAQ